MISYLKYRLVVLVNKLRDFFQHEQNTQVEQVMILNQYVLMKKLLQPNEMPLFKDIGFKVYSQFEEDGILLYIFSVIGTINKKVVEICAGNGKQCMAANLIINHGWDGLLFDGNKINVDNGINFFATHQSTYLFPPIFKHAWLTKENINSLLIENNFTDNIDLLSIDIDGNDCYIMEAINVIKPRVIICETHNIIPSEFALTMPYKADFNYKDGKQNEEFRSVSLFAMKKLLFSRGYRLVGSHRYGFNAIFILNGVGESYFPEILIQNVHDNAYTKYQQKVVWKEAINFPWVTV